MFFKKMKNKDKIKGFTLLELFFVFPYSIALSFQFGMILNNFYQNILISIIGGIIFYFLIMFLTVGLYGYTAMWFVKKKNKIFKIVTMFLCLFPIIPLIVFPYFFLNESTFIIILNFVLVIPVVVMASLPIYIKQR